jgi:hypothetical protein
MERLRNASRWIAAVWLVSQLVAVVASTLILRAAATSTGGGRRSLALRTHRH